MGRWAFWIVLLVLLVACGTPSAAQPTSAPAAAAPEATIAPAATPTEAPTSAPESTAVPEATSAPVLTGAAPTGVDCPADHPVKGNVRDRNPNKGERIYHLPGDNGYAQTKPERCFADAAEAEAAGYRPVKK